MPEQIHLGPLTINFLIEGASVHNALAMFEFLVPPGAKVPAAHSHDAYDETLYQLEGTLTLTLAGTPHTLSPGQTLFIPRGIVHRFDNLHPAPSKTLATITPGILSPNYFRDIAALLHALPPGTPPNPADFAPIMRRHGLTPAP